jgi:hypothetical protein
MIGRPTPRRAVAAALFVAAASAALASAGPDALVPFRDAAGAATEVSVAFVVDFGGAIGPVVKCVPVPSGDNGYQALAAFTTLENEAPPVFASSGLLCSINGDPSSGCGQAVPGGYIYWSYWQGSSGQWQYANSGATATVQNGDVEGWRFENPGRADPNDPPPAAAPAYAAICGTGVAATTTTAPTSAPPAAGGPGPASSGPQAAPASAGAHPASSSQGTPGTQASTPAKGAPSASLQSPPNPAPGATGTPMSKPSGSASPSGPSNSGAQAQALRASAAAARQEDGGSPAPLLIGGGILAVLIAASVVRWRKRAETG